MSLGDSLSRRLWSQGRVPRCRGSSSWSPSGLVSEVVAPGEASRLADPRRGTRTSDSRGDKPRRGRSPVLMPTKGTEDKPSGKFGGQGSILTLPREWEGRPAAVGGLQARHQPRTWWGWARMNATRRKRCGALNHAGVRGPLARPLPGHAGSPATGGVLRLKREGHSSLVTAGVTPPVRPASQTPS